MSAKAGTAQTSVNSRAVKVFFMVVISFVIDPAASDSQVPSPFQQFPLAPCHLELFVSIKLANNKEEIRKTRLHSTVENGDTLRSSGENPPLTRKADL
jgi:hypothetical protein